MIAKTIDTEHLVGAAGTSAAPSTPHLLSSWEKRQVRASGVLQRDTWVPALEERRLSEVHHLLFEVSLITPDFTDEETRAQRGQVLLKGIPGQ